MKNTNQILSIVLRVISLVSLITSILIDETGLRLILIALSLSTLSASFDKRIIRFSGAIISLAILLISFFI